MTRFSEFLSRQKSSSVTDAFQRVTCYIGKLESITDKVPWKYGLQRIIEQSQSEQRIIEQSPSVQRIIKQSPYEGKRDPYKTSRKSKKIYDKRVIEKEASKTQPKTSKRKTECLSRTYDLALLDQLTEYVHVSDADDPVVPTSLPSGRNTQSVNKHSSFEPTTITVIAESPVVIDLTVALDQHGTSDNPKHRVPSPYNPKHRVPSPYNPKHHVDSSYFPSIPSSPPANLVTSNNDRRSDINNLPLKSTNRENTNLSPFPSFQKESASSNHKSSTYKSALDTFTIGKTKDPESDYLADGNYLILRKATEECPMCYTVICPSRFTFNVITFEVTYVCVNCGLTIFFHVAPGLKDVNTTTLDRKRKSEGPVGSHRGNSVVRKIGHNSFLAN
ncbi:hypothetical protein Pcinc_040410 [Petrolisthes cinctipes]|uniref:Uncharacterized protein n=1 Tax=Petrolisthes cinctipes TaxID=88211 RepID=A0AAE1EI18_PETCI|nr:hypothetical protein Pcinc_040410 [Petrolisthes cinctipes]